MKNIKYIQEIKKNPPGLNSKNGKFLNKLFHSPGQILPPAPLQSPAILRRGCKKKMLIHFLRARLKLRPF
jgi:hypothetical protein